MTAVYNGAPWWQDYARQHNGPFKVKSGNNEQALSKALDERANTPEERTVKSQLVTVLLRNYTSHTVEPSPKALQKCLHQTIGHVVHSLILAGQELGPVVTT